MVEITFFFFKEKGRCLLTEDVREIYSCKHILSSLKMENRGTDSDLAARPLVPLEARCAK